MSWLLVQFIGRARSRPCRCIAIAFISVLASGFIPARAQDSLLKRLAGVRVVTTWTDGTDADRQAIQTDVELKLRQVGMQILNTCEQPPICPGTLYVWVGGSGAVINLSVALVETVSLEREWEIDSIAAELKQPPTVASRTPRTATTWMRYGVALNARTESVQEIIDRYQRIPQFQTPAGRAYLAPLLDHEVQAAIANAQHTPSSGTVRDTIKSYVDIFLNEWLAANPKQR
jgi:hypothetical protein